MANKKKIIILTYYDFPCQHPVLENIFAKELAKKHEIVWLFQGDVSQGNKLQWHNSQVLLSKKITGVSYTTKVLNLLLKGKILFTIRRFISRGEVKIILIRDLPFVLLLLAPWRNIYKFKLYFQYSAPQGDINLKNARLDRSIKKFYYGLKGTWFNYLVNKALRRADLIFPISEFHKQQLSAAHDKAKMVPITMGVDVDWINARIDTINTIEKINNDTFIITYFGTLSLTRNPDFMLKVFSLVKKKCANSKLLLIGKTANLSEQQQLEELCHKLGIKDDVIFTGHVPRNIVRSYLAYSDISISAIPPDGHYKISSPTKLYESLGCGVPVVANRGIEEQEKVILESGGGVLVDYDITQFSDAISSLFSDKTLIKKMAIRGKSYVIKNYDYSNIAKKISQYF